MARPSGTIAATLMTWAKVDQFWIANALYLAFVPAAIASAVVKIIAYRRGF